jgi:hypothetical protein
MKRFTIALFALVCAASAFGQSSKISKEFTNTTTATPVDVIIKFQTDPSDPASDAHHQLVIGKGGQYKKTHHVIRAGSYRVNAN